MLPNVVPTNILFVCAPALVVEAFQHRAVNGIIVKGQLNTYEDIETSVSQADVVLLCLSNQHDLAHLIRVRSAKTGVKIIGLLCVDDVERAFVEEAIRSGLDGLVRVMLRDSADKLVHCIQQVKDHQGYFDPDLMRHAMAHNNPRAAFAALSTREQEVCALVVSGYNNTEIAGQLFIATDTVKKHLNRIFGKLRVTKRTEIRSFLPLLDAKEIVSKILKRNDGDLEPPEP